MQIRRGMGYGDRTGCDNADGAYLCITTASFYAMEKSAFSSVLTFIEPLFMLALMFILPLLFGGQVMIWWSTVFARILSALLAVILKDHEDKKTMIVIQKEG